MKILNSFLLVGLLLPVAAFCEGAPTMPDRGLPQVLPVDHSVLYTPFPTLLWEEIRGAASYSVEISLDPDFEEIVDRDQISIPHYVPSHPLEAREYYWRATPVGDEIAKGGSTTVHRFEVRYPERIFDIPSGAEISTIERTIAEAAKQTPAVVRFPKNGKLRLVPSSSDLIRLQGVSDLIIEGRGCEVIFENPASGFARFVDCERITVRDLTIRFDPLPYAIGKIRSVDPSTGQFEVVMDHEELLPFDDPLLAKHWTWGVVLDGKVPGKMADDTPLVVSTEEGWVEKTIGDDGVAIYTLKLKAVHLGKFLVPGNKFIVFARKKGRGLVRIERGSDFTFYGLTNFGASAGHYTSFGSSGLKVIGCQSLIPDGQWAGGNADGLHVRSNLIGPWVQDCRFEGLGDDAIAIYAKGLFILSQDSETRIRVDGYLFDLNEGQRLRIFDPRTGKILVSEIGIADIEKMPAGSGGFPEEHFLLTLTEPLSVDLETGNEDPLLNDQVFNQTMANHRFVVRNNFFERIRRFGTVVRAVDGLIEGNRYDRISNIPIVLRNEPDLWRNGLNSENIRILNNTITNSGYVRGREEMGQIHVAFYKMGHELADSRSHRNLTISGNTIENWQDYGIAIRNASGVTITDNLLRSDEENFDNGRRHSAIFIDDSEGVFIQGNQIEDRRPLDAEVEITANTDSVVWVDESKN
ncbi:right-handed parallel beta-helix repeat-containing protein [Puniceicoccus vermicola]|uniref:Right-handed parallel beta-helix repeat-containing protein n=1 Tax=Puniceicoccus vermicola TaxID=388746 RepID=A0A7X1E4K9_9BACT|nr:right-handed parallel beta-helix repeat-containing protein [Puniceicoccus vermicola]MBC2602164.1 right-handed parallel beta-helix repeat-containing protein [Puniceicoccus vermicola]